MALQYFPSSQKTLDFNLISLDDGARFLLWFFQGEFENNDQNFVL